MAYFSFCKHLQVKTMDILSHRGYSGFERIDSGGQANVYRSRKGGKQFAIKVVKVSERRQEKLDQDLQRELNISKNAHHPNLIHVEEIFRTRTRVYIVMDFMTNGTIGSLVRNYGPLCEWNVRSWFPAIALAIKYLHQHKVAHRDLKLDNILLDPYLNPIVSDFGFSLFVEHNPSGQILASTNYCGTTSHNPPEILRQIPYDPFKGDIWCLGVLLFIMINQIYPFDKTEGKNRMYERQYNRDYRMQPEIEANVSEDIKDLIRILLEPQPVLRPSIQLVCSHRWFPIVHQEGDWAEAAND